MKTAKKYDGQIIKSVEGFTAVILKAEPNRPNFDIVKERENISFEEACSWIDDEIAQFESGNGA